MPQVSIKFEYQKLFYFKVQSSIMVINRYVVKISAGKNI